MHQPDRSREPDETLALHTPAPAGPVQRRVPDRLGPYRFAGELGRGGMGVVYVAEDSRLHRQVAIKMLPERVAHDPAALDQLDNEARLLAALNHPNIATVHSLENIDGCRFITLELIQGETLATMPRGRLTLPNTLRMFRQIAEGLSAAHAKGIIHCDLKPANVVVTATGIPKILDFGIARALGADADDAGRPRGFGTPGYASPEQVAGLRPDPRADTWAFGCLLYESLSGRKAVRGDSVDELLAATTRDEVDLSALPDELPTRVTGLLRRCLAKDPAQRLAHIADAIEILDDAEGSFWWHDADDSVSAALRRSLRVGDPAAPFELVAADGATVRLADLLLRGPLVLCFYRGRWCPACTDELESFQQRLPQIASLGGAVVAISPQMVRHNRRLVEEHGLDFLLLSDPGNHVARAYGVAFSLRGDLRDFHRNLGLDLREYNGDDSWVLPIPATFVLDRQGTVRYVATSRDPIERPDPDEAVQVLAELNEDRGS